MFSSKRFNGALAPLTGNDAVLGESNEMHRQIIAHMGEGLFVLDYNLRYRVWNPYLENLLDLPSARMLGRHPAEIFPEIRTNGRLALIERVLTGQTIDMPDAQPVMGPSNLIWVQTRLSPLRNDRGEITGIIGAVRDITERKRVEGELRLARFAMERVGTGIVWIEKGGRIVDANDALCAMLGHTHAELLNVCYWQIDPDLNETEWNMRWERLKQSGSSHLEGRATTRDGRILPVEVSANYISFGDRELNCTLMRDITIRKQAEETVRISEERYRLIVETAEEGIW
ncbi:MAG: PAS domain S-box protein, partial [Planctomycetota bacterium]